MSILGLTRDARRDLRLSGLGRSGLSSCSFFRNSWGKRMSMGKESLLLMSCSGWDETWTPVFAPG